MGLGKALLALFIFILLIIFLMQLYNLGQDYDEGMQYHECKLQIDRKRIRRSKTRKRTAITTIRRIRE